MKKFYMSGIFSDRIEFIGPMGQVDQKIIPIDKELWLSMNSPFYMTFQQHE